MYRTERITDDSYATIQLLYMQSFDHHESIENIQKKYDTSVFGLKNIGKLAIDENGTPGAYYGVFPITAIIDGKDYLFAQSGDTMTAPDHRKKGLFTLLAKETYALCRDQHIQCVFGFPNQNSFPGFKNNLEWEFHGHMWKFQLVAGTLPLCELAAKFRWLRPAYGWFVKRRMHQFKMDVREIDLEVFKNSSARGEVKKDAHFFEYKLRGENVFFIQFEGFTLLIKAMTHLYVGLVNVINEDQVNDLVQAVKKLGKIVGSRKVIFTLSDNHWLFSSLKAHIEPQQSHPVGFFRIAPNLPLASIQFTGADYDTF